MNGVIKPARPLKCEQLVQLTFELFKTILMTHVNTKITAKGIKKISE